MLLDCDCVPEELAVENGDELCRRLLTSQSGWGSSTRHMEAIALLTRVHGTGDRPTVFVVLMLCACRRWKRVTAEVIAAFEGCGLLGDVELDELAECFLAEDSTISYPLNWFSRQWLELDLDDGTSRAIAVSEDDLGQCRASIAPPLRRWAARRALRASPCRVDELLARATMFGPRHRDALVHGLLDAADALNESNRRCLVARGLLAASTSTRRAALDRLCELEGPDSALRRALVDTNASVRTWRSQHPRVHSDADVVRSMTRPPINPAELDALIEEATIDCYNEDEQVTGLLTMIEDSLDTPFEARVLGSDVTAERIELADCGHIVAICARGNQRQAIPIIDLRLPTAPPAGAEWIEAYRRWLR
ncbi:MAG TPA: hypothetical protein VGO80_03945 [Solirubrobacteraceae bacterium]|jgi:hypothetical protein|nr:hypothetical protein [Solirubrobacteraceae bacterium]